MRSDKVTRAIDGGVRAFPWRTWPPALASGLAVALLLCLWLAASPPEHTVDANASGKTGFSKMGCTGCHVNNTTTQLTNAVLDVPAQVNPGATILVTASVTGTTSNPGAIYGFPAGGLDVSVSGGTLSPGTNTNYNSALNEISHKNPNSISWVFTWTAPSSNGAVEMWMAAMLSNGGGNQAFDASTVVSRVVNVGNVPTATPTNTPSPTPSATPPPTSTIATWISITTPMLPPARELAFLGFDPNRGKAVLFGGAVGFNDPFSDTWEFDGANWTILSTTVHPSARSRGALAYDSNRRRMVLFGGWDQKSVSYLGDTWELSGTTWISVTTTLAPSEREGYALAYDSARERAVLFGGIGNSGLLSDTWEYDGTAWTPVTPTLSPPPRAYAAMAFDSVRNRMVLFGGANGQGNALMDVYADTWEYDGITWTPVVTAGAPPGRGHGQMAFDPARTQMVLFGGLNQNGILPEFYGDTWLYDGVRWLQIVTTQSPSARYGDRLTGGLPESRVMLFGGRDATGALNDTWEFPSLFPTPTPTLTPSPTATGSATPTATPSASATPTATPSPPGSQPTATSTARGGQATPTVTATAQPVRYLPMILNGTVIN